uniref:uncharacterized protein At1g51745-like n=1 Tax=Erigeron canadensis TaxID=72917 RepID=UPI001CB8C0A4|nr:uncharacterized protein At1g51745-like [Erigeron canadensis]
MGESSDAEGGGGGMVDCGVGTIVWVRRRNGSWWPGKILGPQHLSSSHLMSPRSGTPVKLLGREDASVDWYNLEKSKRVKPFRCGEFDDCIERAEASQGMPPKKREKYARREDAILHALHLEKQLHNNINPSPTDNNIPPPSTASSHHPHQLQINNNNNIHDDDNDDDDDHDDDDDCDDNDDDDDDVTTPPTTFTHLPSPIPFPTNPSSSTPQSTIPIPVTTNSLHKRKRSLEEEEEDDDENLMINKRRDRRLPLVQLLNSSPQLSTLRLQGVDDSVWEGQTQVANDPLIGGVTSADSFDYAQSFPDQLQISTPKFEKRVIDSFHAGSSEDNTTGSNEDTETDSSGTESLLSDTYMAALSDEGEHIEFIPKVFRRSEVQGEHESMSDDSGLPDDSGDSLPTSVTVSKWQLKGKRNSRRYPERKVSMSANHWMSFKEEETYDANSSDKNLGSQMMGYRPRGLESISWEDTTPLQGYWEQSIEYHDPVYFSHQFGGRMNSTLIDVDLQVQSSYQREHVPMISLMSKLNDKAIVGHPIPVEILEDGISDIILSAAVEFQMESATLQPWRTARRTAKCRVPRPPHLSTLDEVEEAFEYVDESTGSVNRKGSMSRKPLKKAQRKASLSYNQKIRTLSSIGGSQQQRGKDLKAECFVGKGVMKPESLPPAVACIPVKLVFSRLHEELVARHQ